jgi:hypothetical protein
LLARAVELDAQHVSRLSVAQLREIAREAGIAPDAFDAALVGRADSTEQGSALWTALATNAVAAAAFLALARDSRASSSG